MKQLLLAASLAALATAPAAAQDMMPKSTGHWSVLGLGESCIAVNRLPAEFNAAPYNALAFHQYKADDLPRIQAFFWPGALTEGADVSLQVTPLGQSTIEIPAKAVTSFQVVTNEPAPEDLLEALTVAPSAQVSAQGLDQLLLFDTTTVEAVADEMRECVQK